MPIVIDFNSRDWLGVPLDEQNRASDYMANIMVGYRQTHGNKHGNKHGWLWGTAGVVCTWCHVPFLKDELGIEDSRLVANPVPETAVCLECAEAEYLGSQGRSGGAGSVLDPFRVPAGAEEQAPAELDPYRATGEESL